MKELNSNLEVTIQQLLTTDTQAHLAASVKHTSLYEVWHKRLGHAPIQKLAHIPELKQGAVENKVCVTCPMAKFTKLTYPVSTSKSTKVFKLIHMDIWGPYRVPTHNGYATAGQRNEFVMVLLCTS